MVLLKREYYYFWVDSWSWNVVFFDMKCQWKENCKDMGFEVSFSDDVRLREQQKRRPFIIASPKMAKHVRNGVYFSRNVYERLSKGRPTGMSDWWLPACHCSFDLRLQCAGNDSDATGSETLGNDAER